MDSDSSEDREGHRTVARWIKNFITTCKNELADLDHANRNPTPLGDPEYMEFDSESKVPTGTVTS